MPREQDWYRLDNAGVLYSALKKEKYAPVYRFSAVMAEKVDPEALQRAVDRVMPRFPSFRVRIRKGGLLVLLRAQPQAWSLCPARHLQPLPAHAGQGG